MTFAIVGAVLLFLLGLAAVAEARRLRNMLEEVKEIAWTNRDIAPELSTIIIDTIRTREDSDRRRELP
jgi:hypothetical protein